MQVTMVPTEYITQAWGDVKPHLQKAAEYTYGRYDIDDILDSILQYDHHLWMAYEDGIVKGAAVTYFKQYPKKKYLDLVFCGGVSGMEWKAEMLKILQHWAFDNHCDGIESSGRLGWSKIFQDDGYKPLWQTYELPIATSGLGA